jgi:hypothetical protein
LNYITVLIHVIKHQQKPTEFTTSEVVLHGEALDIRAQQGVDESGVGRGPFFSKTWWTIGDSMVKIIEVHDEW